MDLNAGEPTEGIRDDHYVKNQLHHSCTVTATTILLVDEFTRAGMSPLKGKLNWSFPCIIWIMKTLQSDPKTPGMEFWSKPQMISKGIFFSHMKKWDNTGTYSNSEVLKLQCILNCSELYTHTAGYIYPMNRMFFFSLAI